MAEPKRIVAEPWDVKRRLESLGLSVEILMEAVRKSQAARADCTENDAPNFSGISSWNAAVRCLREGLGILGWKRVNDTGQPLIVHPNEALALTVASSDENTGKEGLLDPKTKSCKGPRTIEKVRDNGWLFRELAEDEAQRIKDTNRRRTNLWMLLVHYDKKLEQVRSELARPDTVDQEGHVVGWSERIILSPFSVEPVFQASPEEESGPEGEDIDIEIKRRA